MKLCMVLCTFVFVVDFCLGQDILCGLHPDPECVLTCLFPPMLEASGKTVNCNQSAIPDFCAIDSLLLVCEDMSVDETDLVSERVTQIIELCQTMVYQIFPNSQVFSATAASSGDNFGTIAYTLDYTWINLPDERHLTTLACEVFFPSEFIENDMEFVKQ